MVRRALLAGLSGLLLTVAAPGVAHATVSDGNSLGSYTCNAYGTGDHNASWTCTVKDKKCDGVGVYVQYAYSNSNVMSGWSRGSSNAGGCGHSRKSTRSASWVGTIDRVHFKLCVDLNNRPDRCYDGTIRSDS